MKEAIDFILHIQEHLTEFTQAHGPLVYGLLFLVIFCETGLVVTPFLPGDSLLFAVGAIAAVPASGLNIWIAGLVMLVAAILGDTVNYWIGRRFGGWMMRTFPRIVKPSHIAKTNEFFVKYGGKTIILARFVPIVRTFAPFVAGSGDMDYGRFMLFNVVGAILWVVLILPAGWFFGNMPVVKENFELVVLGIIGFSVLPMVWEIARAKMKPKETVEAE
ncbi:DedA family protein [Luteolibacter sp. Populi]|uniref:DedA family protein n=1 Tax=Luteolibacter sp. Populi TaxID=3230487 RepID=UPI003464F32B